MRSRLVYGESAMLAREFKVAYEEWGRLLELARNGKLDEAAIRGSEQKRYELLYEHRPPEKWGEKISLWNKDFKLGLSESQITDLVDSLPGHLGLLQPTSFDLTLGRSREEDWNVALRILEQEVSFSGRRFRHYGYRGLRNDNQPSKSEIRAVQLDFKRFRDVRVPAYELHTNSWPGVEVVMFFALNPLIRMDGRTFPDSLRLLGAPRTRDRIASISTPGKNLLIVGNSSPFERRRDSSVAAYLNTTP